MDIDLRPLSLGQILDRTFQFYRSRFLLFFGIAAVAGAVEMVWSLVQMLESSLLLRHHISPILIQSINSGVSILAWVVTFGVSALAMAATNRALYDLYEDRRTGILAAYAQIRSHWFRYLWLNIVTFFLAWGLVVAIVGGVAGSIAVAAQTKSLTQANVVTAIYSGMGLLIFLALPLCIWLTLRYSMANAASVSEDLGIRKSLKRSVLLSKDLRARIFVLLLVIFLAQFFFGIALAAPVFAVIVRHPNHVSVVIRAYILAVGFLGNALIKPIYCIGLTLFYLDARIRKEGYDVEWALHHQPEIALQSPDTTTPLSEPMLG